MLEMDNKDRTKDVLIEESINFDSLLLSSEILNGLKDNGFEKPSPIQLKAIPLGKCGFDLIIKSKSGTGKTAVFAIITLEMLNIQKNEPQVLILAPTREIAVQICDEIKKIGCKIEGLKCEYFIGGIPIENDLTKLKNCHIAVGAPGRIRHLIENKALKTDSIKLFILDEADKLMESSYQSGINYIYYSLPKQKQMLALSATYPDELDKFLSKYMHSPTQVSPSSESLLLLGLKHFVSVVKHNSNVIHQMNIKMTELIHILTKTSFTQCIIFSNFQTRAENISNTLNRKDWNSIYISGAQTQTQRLDSLQKLKEFKSRILLTTDLTARGIDAVNVDLVINFDVPHDASTYLHRMGRAGRYGSKGLCITLASNGKELQQLQNILGMIGGSEISIPKIDSNNLSTNIWDAEPNSFEFIYGSEDCKGLDEKTLRIQNIKQSLLELKNSKEHKKEKINKKEETQCVEEVTIEEKSENANDVQEMDSLLLLQQMSETKSKCNLIENENTFNTIDILTSLSKNEEIESPNKRKRNEVNTALLRNEKRSNSDAPLKNIALYHAASILKNDEITDDSKNAVEHIETYIEQLKCDEAETKSNKVIEPKTNKSNSNQYASNQNKFENIFEIAFNHAVGLSKIHWLEEIGDTLESDDEKNLTASSINLLESDPLESQEDYYQDTEEPEDMSSLKVKKRQSRSRKKRNSFNNEVAKFQDTAQEEDAPTMQWVPCDQYNAGLTNSYEYYNNDKFVANYNYCGNNLYAKAYEFEDVASFDNYFIQWQQQVESVRNFVQQNIYLQEMNYYQSYKQ